MKLASRKPWQTAVGVLLTAVMLFPVYWMINESFTTEQNMRKSPPNLLPVHGTLAGYQAVLSQQLPYLGTSLIVGLGTVALTLAVAAPAGYALAKLRPRGAGLLGFALLIAQMIPGIIMAMGFYAIFLRLGILNTVYGLVIADSTIAVPFGVLVFAAFMSGIPEQILQAALTDGAGQLRTFRSIVLPLSRNAIITVSLFAFLWAWSDFVFANTLDGGGSSQPITLGIYHYIGNNDQQWNAIMATAVVASIPAAILLVLAQRYVAAGVTAGAVKDLRLPEMRATSSMSAALPAGPLFSVREIPFSYYGSWFGISPVTGKHAYADDLHLVSHCNGLHPVLVLRPQAGGDPAGSEPVATPTMLSWQHPQGRVDLTYESADTIRVRGTGLGFCVQAAASTLTPFTGTYLYRDAVDGGYVFTSYETGRRYRVTVLTAPATEAVGSQALGEHPRQLLIAGGGEWELAVTELSSTRAPYAPEGTFAQVAARAAARFAAFTESVAPWRTDRSPAAELAAYVLWSATVSPAGFLRRPAVLMSKHWMDKVWSWDHCFNAIALADGQPDLARDQFMVMFDHQDESGALPDSVTHSEVLYNFVKPPIHGWALSRLSRRLPEPLEAAELYPKLAAWTTFWLDRRRAPGSELPHYQHGNDSGWDNATTFDSERTVVTADLAAFLVLQLHELAGLAVQLGRGSEAGEWRSRAERMTSALLDELWTGERFQVRGVETGQTRTTCSLLDLMPIVLGNHLPEAVHNALAARIAAHLTEYGPATELPSSPHYAADGYWRGPVWAPATLLIEDGLRRAGHVPLADEISARFRALCEKSGFAENFDALTGAGQRDRAYTWTASSYLILAADFERRRTAERESTSVTCA